MRKRALIVANQVYDDERFVELPGAAGDARQLAKVLESRTIGEFDVSVVPDENARMVRRAIEVFLGEARRGDLLLLHLSCHGKREDRSRELHFVARDTEYDYLAATGISAQFVNDRIEQSRCGRVVLMLDCCYSGSYVKGMKQRGGTDRIEVDQHFQGQGKAVLTACSSLQFAYESTALSMPKGEPSVFTSTVVEGLRTGLADVDSDGFISVDDLYRYVHKRVSRQLPAQTPELSVDRLSGSLYLARNIRTLYLGSDTAPRLPTALHRAVVDGAEWERFGATLGLERLLDEPRSGTREAAREALVPLTRDPDPQVAARARQVWSTKIGSAIPLSARPLARPDLSAVARDRPVAGRMVGIDFGTTNSTMAVLDGGRPKIIPNRLGEVLTPSVVGLRSGRVEVGEVARQQAALDPTRTVSAIKRELGTDWTTRIDGEEYSAENMAAFILDQLRRDAEAYIGEPIGMAVITVPAYYGVVERVALRRAAHLAGLDAYRLLNEPTAAAMAYYDVARPDEQTVLVFDLGGGTLDVSVVELGDGVVEVRATGGDERLGGDDWDQRIVDWLVERAGADHGLDPTGDETATQRLKETAEQAKIALSTAERATVTLPFLGSVAGRPVHFTAELDRTEFEHRTADLLERCRTPVLLTLQDSGIKPADIDGVVLAGGSAVMPAIAAMLEELTGGKEPVEGIDPRTAIAVGAALQAGILTGEVKEFLPLDVISISLGIETKGGVFTKLIKRNTTLPAKRAEIFSTADDNQTTVGIQVYQGEQEFTRDNKKLGTFDLTGLPPAPRGQPQIEITFNIDVNGVVDASAKDLSTDKEIGITLSGETERSHTADGPPEEAPMEPVEREEDDE